MTKNTSISASSSISASPSLSAGFIIFLLYAGLLLPVVLDMTKPFHIKKPVTNGNNTIATKTLKDVI